MAKKSAEARAPSAIEVLEEDHDYVKKAYRAFQKLDPEEDLPEIQALVEQVCDALKVHMRLEEEILYPAARKALSEEDVIEEAEVEHDSAKTLIRSLGRMKPKDPKYAATFTVLCEYIEHHVKEEEDEMFPKLQRSGINLRALGAKLMAKKARLAG